MFQDGVTGMRHRDAAIVEPLVIEVRIAAQLFHLLRIIGQERFIPGAVVFAHMGVARFIPGRAGGTEVAQVLDARGAEAFDQVRRQATGNGSHVAQDGFAAFC